MINSKLTKNRGFTIVELLVVIVVIGILTAITIVSYTGVTSRAKTAANESNASAVIAAAEAVYADTGVYPATGTTANLSAGAAKISSSIVFGTPPTATNYTYMAYTLPAATHVCVGYWDFSANAVRYVGGGAANVAADRSTCS